MSNYQLCMSSQRAKALVEEVFRTCLFWFRICCIWNLV